MESEYHLTFKQVLTRIISVIVCGIGTAGCIYSLSLQVDEVGTMTASLTWFSGLGAVVLAIAGYAVTVDPGRGKSRLPLAVVLILAIGVVCAMIYMGMLYDMAVVFISLACCCIEGIVLIIYHFVLKSEDPDAL